MVSEPREGGFASFLVCLLVHMTFPLLPLMIEQFLTDDISAQSLTIAVAMYAIGMGASSKVRVLSYLMLAASLLFSAAYGYLLYEHKWAMLGVQHSDVDVVIRLKKYSYWVIAGIFAFHAIERFSRHVVNGEPFGA